MNMLLSFISKYGILSTCIIILIEYACFPISSEIVLPLSGALSKLNNFNLPLLIILSVICGLIGSTICYLLGKFLGNKCISFLITRFPKAQKAFNISYSFFNKYGNKAVLIARVIPLCRTYISFISGILNQPYSSFLFYSSIGILLWNTILISLGYILGNSWNKVISIYNNYKYCILVLLFILVIIYIFKLKQKKEKSQNT